MTTTFTCPHCGRLAQSDIPVYAADLDNGCPPSYFPTVDLDLKLERHIDTRLCCQKCWTRASTRLPAGEVHPYRATAHRERLAHPVGVVIGAPQYEE